MTPAQFWANVVVDEATGCWLWQGRCGKDGTSYGKATVDGRRMLTHRQAWTLTHGVPPPDGRVRHTCDTPPCINPAHLVLGTQAENVADMDAKGRRGSAHGTLNGRARLTAAQVADIRARYVSRRHGGIQAIANEYGVGYSTIRDVVTNETWR